VQVNTLGVVEVIEEGNDTGKGECVTRLVVFSETYLGPRPSPHHYPRLIVKEKGICASNVIWFAPGIVIDFKALSHDEREHWHAMPSPYKHYLWHADGLICRYGFVSNVFDY
jgi:hypothetical protein